MQSYGPNLSSIENARLLLLVTLLVAVCSEGLVDSVEACPPRIVPFRPLLFFSKPCRSLAWLNRNNLLKDWNPIANATLQGKPKKAAEVPMPRGHYPGDGHLRAFHRCRLGLGAMAPCCGGGGGGVLTGYSHFAVVVGVWRLRWRFCSSLARDPRCS